MPRSWSEAVKACHLHPQGVQRPNGDKRACSCNVGWRYRMGRPGPDGRLGRPQWSRTFPTKTAADADQRTVRQAITEGRYATDGGLTLSQWLDKWLARKRVQGRKLSTVDRYQGIAETRIKPLIGHVRLERLTRTQVQAALDSIASSRQLGPGKAHLPVNAGTVRGVHRVLRSALTDARRAGLVTQNVAEDVELPPVPKHDPVAFTVDQVSQWLTYVEPDRLSAMWECFAMYGPRRAELLGLRWPAIDTTQKLIYLQATLNELSGQHHLCPYCDAGHLKFYFDTPKTAAGVRIWPLIPAVEAALMAHKLRQDDERAAYGPTYADHGLVFAQPDGNPLDPDLISDWFGRTFTKSGAADGMTRTPPLKSLRSTAYTLLHQQGVPMETIAAIIGHEGTAVGRRHYLSVSAEDVRAELGEIGRLIRPGRSDHGSDQQPGIVDVRGLGEERSGMDSRRSGH